MDKVVSPNQTGCIPNRNIHENIVVAQELLQSMNNLKGKNGLFSIKVDQEKAYDKMNWKFVEKVIIELSIPQKLRYIIMSSISSVRMRTTWNGHKGDYFNLKKGLKQGDPISPYLFVLCIDRLYHMIMDVVDNKEWECTKVGRKGPKVSHMMFADDLLLFGKAIV